MMNKSMFMVVIGKEANKCTYIYKCIYIVHLECLLHVVARLVAILKEYAYHISQSM